MLGLNHIFVIGFVLLLCYCIFYRTNIINNKIENFNSEHVIFHKEDDYNVVSHIEENNHNN